MITGYFWLNDGQWEKIDPLLPAYVRGKRRVDDRRVISGIVQVIISGCRWSDAPLEYGPRKTLYTALSAGRCAGSASAYSWNLRALVARRPKRCWTAPTSRSTARPAPGDEKRGFAC